MVHSITHASQEEPKCTPRQAVYNLVRSDIQFVGFGTPPKGIYSISGFVLPGGQNVVVCSSIGEELFLCLSLLACKSCFGGRG